MGEHRVKSAILFLVGIKAATVSFTNHEGIRHSVGVYAGTLYETVVLAVRAFRYRHPGDRESDAGETQ